MNDLIRVMVVDDHGVVRAGVQAILQEEEGAEIVALVEDGPSSIKAYRQYRPDVVLMDVRMPKMSGIEATRLILKEHTQAKVVMLTTYDTEEDIYQAMEAGARGDLLKTALDDELYTAISRVFAGETYLPPTVAKQLAVRRASKGLTPREMDVLALVAKGMSNRDIGELLGMTERTARFHLTNVFYKLSAADRTEAVAIAMARRILNAE